MGGCGPLIETKPPPDLYSLTPKSTFPEEMPQVDWQLVIEEPIAARGLDTPRIAVRPSPTQLQYVAGSRWTSRAPKMVQTLLVESFENSGRIVAVGRHAIGLRSDYNLKTELREFQAEYYDGEKIGLVRVRLNAKLIKQPQQEIIASENFERLVRAENEGMQAIVDAFDEALGGVMKKVVVWTLITPDS
jgi:cholesterol transport system auxiliary component